MAKYLVVLALLLSLLVVASPVSALSKQRLSLPAIDNLQPTAGDPLAIEKIGGYSKLTAKFLVWWAGMSKKLPVKNGLDMYRVTYLTSGERGGLVEVSGLLTIPRVASAKSVISWQHGTSLRREDAPSKPTADEGVLASIIFAGDGSVLLAPDYIGFGKSELPHPYYHLPTSVASTRDLLLASKAILEASGFEFPARLFLAGFSQGGYCTMATTRNLEQSPIPGINLIASASVAGPIDLDGFTFNNSLKGEAESASMYLAYIFNTYARIYLRNLADVFREPYDHLVPQLFDGVTSGEAIAAQLPRDPNDMFREDFLENYKRGDQGWPRLRLSENDLDGWLPKTPLRLYFGRADLDVSPEEAIAQASKWRKAGVDAVAIDVGNFDHNESIIEAAPALRDWFAEL